MKRSSQTINKIAGASVDRRPLEDAALGVGQGVARRRTPTGRSPATIALTLPISSRVTTQKRMSWSAPDRPAAPLVDRDAPAEDAGDRLADRVAPLGDDRDRGVLLDAVEQEVERLRRRDVGQDRVQGRLDARGRTRPSGR